MYTQQYILDISVGVTQHIWLPNRYVTQHMVPNIYAQRIYPTYMDVTQQSAPGSTLPTYMKFDPTYGCRLYGCYPTDYPMLPDLEGIYVGRQNIYVRVHICMLDDIYVG